ncbi:MAG: glycoside hydrolase family 3 C-terminal domain-containing protein, partial [Bacteroidales bacterium]|nr:glycoside hydrolase family 3 C-terminal domain-containing protein [Bacteroidales bacterium]
DMGTAVKQLLFGERDDFGRLPVTFYRSTDQLPPFDDYDMQRRTYRYLDNGTALFPFGFGYSYSFFSIKNPSVDEANFTISGTASLCNTDVPQAPTHRTVVQVYLKDENDPEAPQKQLIGTASLSLTEERHLLPFTIQLDPFWFRRYNPKSGRLEEPKDGTPFTLQVGFSSDDRDLFDLPFTYHNRK